MPAAIKHCPVLADVKAPRFARTLRALALTSAARRARPRALAAGSFRSMGVNDIALDCTACAAPIIFGWHSVVDEPANLTEWSTTRGRLFTCGRPGRATFGRERRAIGDDTIEHWVGGLPICEVLHIVSLLGQKTTGFSEFGYYPFRSSHETGTKPTWQDWLNQKYRGRFVLHEFPTVDGRGIPRDALKTIASHVRHLIESGYCVVIVDSAGAERTARVCEAVGCERLQRRRGRM